jgi:O-antigen/teichoic acid export membrane protein
LKPTQKKQIVHFFENVVSLFSVKLIDLVLALVLIPYLISKVGVVNYGLYAFALSVALYGINITNYSFNYSAVKALAKQPKTTHNLSKICNEVFTVKVYLSSALLMVFGALLLFVPKFAENKPLFYGVAIFLIGDIFSKNWFFLGIEKMKFIPIISLISTLIFVFLVVLLIHQPHDYTYILFVESIGLFVANVLSFIYVRKKYQIKFYWVSATAVKQYLKNNIGAFTNLFIPSMLSNSAVFLVGWFGVPTQVSIMQLGVKVSNAFSTINTILTQVFYAISNRAQHTMQLSAFSILTSGLLLAVAMYISSYTLLPYWIDMNSKAVFYQLQWLVQVLSPMPLLMAFISAFNINGLLVLNNDTLAGVITFSAAIIGGVVGVLVVVNHPIVGGFLFLILARGINAGVSFVVFINKYGFKKTR